MGLLRRAATAATLDDEKTLEPPEAPEVSAPDPAVAEVPPRPIKRQGLLHRSLQALIAAVEAMPQQAEVGPREAEAEAVPQEAVGPHEAAAEVVAPLSVELAPGSIPVAEPADTEPAFDSPPEPALDFASVPAAEPIPELATEPVQGPPPVEAPTPPPTAPSIDADGLIQGIVASIRALPDGIELPSELFTLLVTRLSIQKGALLLYDPLRLVYAPWASQGYDQTTLHKMRIPLGANETWNALANGAPLVLTDPPSTSAYQQYFSARESSSLSPLYLTPFIADSKLVGVLLLTGLSSPFQNDEQTVRCLSAVAEAGSPRVQSARTERLEKAGPQEMRVGESPEEEASHYLGTFKSSGTRILFLSLSLESYARKIISSHKHLDPFRLHEDLQYFLGTFVSDLGKAIAIKQHVYILALQDFEAGQLDLFRHQLALFLHGLFGGNGQSGAEAVSDIRVLKTRVWPTEDGDVAKLLDFLSS